MSPSWFMRRVSWLTLRSVPLTALLGLIWLQQLAASSVETAKINDSAVTAAKLADNSSVTLVSTLPASGDFTGQIALDTDDDKIYVWDGSAWDSVKGAGSINVVNGSTTGEINIVTSTSGDTVTISATLDDTTAAAQFLGGPTGAGGTVGYRALVGTDLPTATTSAKGGVIVNGNGLTMSGDTITIDNTVTAETTDHHIVKYDANGLVTAGRAIAAGDLPVATSSATGAVKPGAGLGVDAAGEISHSNSITGATAAKVTFDAQGHITATEALAASDIPDLDTAKITTGTFPEARIGSAAVSGAKLKDYAVAQISETTPTAEFTSQFFFNPITRDLFLWDGNVFQPVGISAGEIVLAGTYDASTNLLDSVTADGTAAGFTNGASLPSAAAGNNRHYVVVSQSGTGSAPAPTVTLEPPDILLSNGTSYVLIETSETITAQIASNVGFTATGNISATNVQAAVAEVDSEKVAKAGDTMTGNLNLGEDVVLTFEGATDNAFETTLTVVDPTADRSLSLPDVSGTLVSSGDTGTVTSTMILDGTIANADISASAEIAVSKLANGTARQVLQTDSLGTGVEFTDDLDLPGTLDVTGAATLDSTLAVTGATTVTGVINADGKVKFPAGSASAPSFYSGTDTNTGLYFSAADEVSITTGGTQRFAVDSAGRLLVGTSTSSGYSSARLIINSAGSDATASGNLVLQRGEANGSISNGDEIGTITFGDESGYSYANIIANADLAPSSDSPGRLVFSTTADGASSPSERLRIDSSGNVGIGTSAPTASLHVSANDPAIYIQDANGTGNSINSTIQFRDSSDAQQAYFGYASSSDSHFSLFNKLSGGDLVFGTASTERLRIDSSGNLDLGNNDGSASNQGFYLQPNGAGYIFTSSALDAINIYQSGTKNVEISSSGSAYFASNVGIGTTSPSYLLDVYSQSNDIAQFSGINGGSLLVRNPSTNVINLNAQTGDSLTFGTNGNNERVRIDSSGNVGIGTSSPTHTLHLSGSAGTQLKVQSSSANAYINLVNSSASGGYVGYQGDNLTLWTGTTERLRVDSSGRVIVNNGAGSSDNSIFRIEGGTSGASIIEMGDSGDYNIGEIRYDQSSNSMRFTTNASEAMRVDSSGRLLVGTSSAFDGGSGTLLQVLSTGGARFALARNDTTTAANDSIGRIRWYGNDSDGNYDECARIEVIADADHASNSKPSALTFHTTAASAESSSERLRIKSDGTLHAIKSGTQITNAEQTVAVFQRSSASGSTSKISIVSGNGASSHINFGDTDDEDVGQLVYDHSNNSMQFLTNTSERMRIDSSGQILLGATSTSAPSYFFSPDSGGGTLVKDTDSTSSRTAFIFRINGSEVGSIKTSGSSTSYNTSSDYRLKENVIDITDGITRVKQLQPKRFNFISAAETTVDGFLAHEAQTVVPEAVTGTHNEVDDDGNAVMQSIDQSKLVPLLTAALQEAIAKIETLEAKVAALEAE